MAVYDSPNDNPYSYDPGVPMSPGANKSVYESYYESGWPGNKSCNCPKCKASYSLLSDQAIHEYARDFSMRAGGYGYGGYADPNSMSSQPFIPPYYLEDMFIRQAKKMLEQVEAAFKYKVGELEFNYQKRLRYEIGFQRITKTASKPSTVPDTRGRHFRVEGEKDIDV